MADAKVLYESQIKKWRNAAIMLGVNLCILFAYVLWSTMSIRGVIVDTQRSVDILERATGPEAQKHQADVVDELVIRIDCTVREAIQELLDQFDDGIVIIADHCIKDE